MRCRVFEVGEIYSGHQSLEYTIYDGKIYLFDAGDFKSGDLAVHLPPHVTVPACDQRFAPYAHLADLDGRIPVRLISPDGILLQAAHDWPLGYDLSTFLDIK